MSSSFFFPISSSIQKFRASGPYYSDPQLHELFSFINTKSFDSMEKETILLELSRLLVIKEYTLLIARHFRGLLEELVGRLVFTSPPTTQAQRLTLNSAFSKLLLTAPHLLHFFLYHYSQTPSIFESLDSLDTQDLSGTNDEIVEVLETALRFLSGKGKVLAGRWCWSSIFKLLMEPFPPKIRDLAHQCLSHLFNLSEHYRETFKNNFNIPPLQKIERCDKESIESADTLHVYEELSSSNQNEELYTERIPDRSFTVGDLSPWLSDVCGVLLTKPKFELSSSKKPIVSKFVVTGEIEDSLRSLAVAVAQGKPLLLEGISGSGKTSLIHHLAALLEVPDLIKIHLGDQVDAKLLLGTYVCTEVPGEFKWQPGVLTQAVLNGNWLLIEDLDLAPPDLLSLLLPLIENRTLSLPNSPSPIHAPPSFQLFATLTLFGPNAQNARKNYTGSGWTRVVVPPLSHSELSTVLASAFPSLTPIVPSLLETFQSLSETNSNIEGGLGIGGASGRVITTRDLFKWTNRVDRFASGGINQTGRPSDQLQELIYLDALDCFAKMLPTNHRDSIADKLARTCNVAPQRNSYFLTLYKPTLVNSPESVSIGRITLPKSSLLIDKQHEKARGFAYTRQGLLLLESVAACLLNQEPVLLIGETGTGKTSLVQHLSSLLNHKLTVINMSQQSDSSELLGGFKPVELSYLCLPIKNKFEKLFFKSFSRKKNEEYVERVQKTFVKKDWKRFFQLIQNVAERVVSSLDNEKAKQDTDSDKDGNKESKKTLTREKRNKEWKQLLLQVSKHSSQLQSQKTPFVFAFVEGALVRALREGHWLLLDEINLASSETLEGLSGVLQGDSVYLTEKGDLQPIPRHKNFHIFGAMNPPTDVGKKYLPPGIRSRFTEIYVDENLSLQDLMIIIQSYVPKEIPDSEFSIESIGRFYLKVLDMPVTDNLGHKPKFSLRTLCRALEHTRFLLPNYGWKRSLYEGLTMSFVTVLESASQLRVMAEIKSLLENKKSEKELVSAPKCPGNRFVKVQGFWLATGEMAIPEKILNYVLTPTISKHLTDIARVICAGKYPILLQGPTSSGKTSMVEYLATATGHRFVRINNHEHTDIQEYLGSYVSDPTGKLVYQEGILTQAVRNGYWVVLDELNLAPTEVLEALNRLLDENRELFLPETQQVVKAHPHFHLFATQNPPGIYAGRKVLSRAFRNRFVELFVEELPENELETIIEKRCAIPPSYCKKLTAVMKDLQRHRQATKLFAGKHGFITLRDLFRWGLRCPQSYQQLAHEGYMLLAERLRRNDEKLVVKSVLEKHMNVKINTEELYKIDEKTTQLLGELENTTRLVLTPSFKRLFYLTHRSLQFKEPVLLVGETGCGKTTVAQLYAQLVQKALHTVNCHQNSETADFIGSYRPNRTGTGEGAERIFKWYDGPLILAMRAGEPILIDEISLAEDAVLERLNSVLEHSRAITLAEKAGSAELDQLVAEDGFRIIATMNPGGDFGKRELSPAMRNRLTEIWVPAISDKNELVELVFYNLLESFPSQLKTDIANVMTLYREWIDEGPFKNMSMSVRDLLGWVAFINASAPKVGAWEAVCQGCCLSLLDSLATPLSLSASSHKDSLRNTCFQKLYSLLPEEAQMILNGRLNANRDDFLVGELLTSGPLFGVSPFVVEKGPLHRAVGLPPEFVVGAPVSSLNLQRLLRALQLNKPILLEGSPGVGKTALISAVAAAAGYNLTRINLSEQTDLMDLLGADLPIQDPNPETGNEGLFGWRSGAFLQALEAGDWVLLDELNLASQQVLEGLNSVLDHRTNVYLPELNKTVSAGKGFRVFGAMNPTHQGGGRKGLPKSFLHRFSRIRIEPLGSEDMLWICQKRFHEIDGQVIERIIQFNQKLVELTSDKGTLGRTGGPWEFNLRDIFRLCEFMKEALRKKEPHSPNRFVESVYIQRFRTESDRKIARQVFYEVFHIMPDLPAREITLTPHLAVVGSTIIERTRSFPEVPWSFDSPQESSLYTGLLEKVEHLARNVDKGKLSLLIGPSGSGKRTTIKTVAEILGKQVEEIVVSPSLDTSELLGSFEQIDVTQALINTRDEVQNVANLATSILLCSDTQPQKVIDSLTNLHQITGLLSSQDGPLITLLNQTIVSLQQILPSLVHQHSYITSRITKLHERVEYLKAKSERISSSKGGLFEWRDGLLIRAIEEGKWVVLQHANLPSPAVLDRLNPLLEENGYLQVTEQGLDANLSVRTLTPHPEFRLFLTCDPRHGELSRAMRNRGLELYFDPLVCQENENETACDDFLKGLQTTGIRGYGLAERMRQTHFELNSKLSQISYYQETGNYWPPHNLYEWGSFSIALIRRGFHTKEALVLAFKLIYVSSSRMTQMKQIAQEKLNEIEEHFNRSRDSDMDVEFLKDHPLAPEIFPHLVSLQRKIYSPSEANFLTDASYLELLCSKITDQ